MELYRLTYLSNLIILTLGKSIKNVYVCMFKFSIRLVLSPTSVMMSLVSHDPGSATSQPKQYD